jgi:hypothetical protein
MPRWRSVTAIEIFYQDFLKAAAASAPFGRRAMVSAR